MKNAKKATRSLFQGLLRPRSRDSRASQPTSATASQLPQGGNEDETPVTTPPRQTDNLAPGGSPAEPATSPALGVAEGTQPEALAAEPVDPATAQVTVETAPTAPDEGPREQTAASTETRMSKSISELDSAIETFKKNYELFASKNAKYLLVGDEFQAAFAKAEVSKDLKKSAQLFGDGVWGTLQTIERKKTIEKSRWTHKLGNFLTKLYPVVSVSLQITGAISEVFPP
jgi:hypothetical protein